MLTPKLYLELVNGTYGISIEKAKLPGYPRIIRCLETHFKNNPIRDGVRFSHLKTAKYLMKNIKSINVPEEVLNHFEKVFFTLQALSHHSHTIVKGTEITTTHSF